MAVNAYDSDQDILLQDHLQYQQELQHLIQSQGRYMNSPQNAAYKHAQNVLDKASRKDEDEAKGIEKLFVENGYGDYYDKMYKPKMDELVHKLVVKANMGQLSPDDPDKKALEDFLKNPDLVQQAKELSTFAKQKVKFDNARINDKSSVSHLYEGYTPQLAMDEEGNYSPHQKFAYPNYEPIDLDSFVKTANEVKESAGASDFETKWDLLSPQQKAGIIADKVGMSPEQFQMMLQSGNFDEFLQKFEPKIKPIAQQLYMNRTKQDPKTSVTMMPSERAIDLATPSDSEQYKASVMETMNNLKPNADGTRVHQTDNHPGFNKMYGSHNSKWITTGIKKGQHTHEFGTINNTGGSQAVKATSDAMNTKLIQAWQNAGSWYDKQGRAKDVLINGKLGGQTYAYVSESDLKAMGLDVTELIKKGIIEDSGQFTTKNAVSGQEEHLFTGNCYRFLVNVTPPGSSFYYSETHDKGRKLIENKKEIMGYRDISHDSIAEANRQVIEESIARSQRDTHGWTFEETHHPHPQTPQPNPHLHKGNAENNYSTELNPEEQAAYKEYLKHHKMDHQKVNHSYDMTGFFKAYGMFDWNKVPTEEFTKPNHKHFTTDSIYSSSENPGGGWETDKTGHKVYVSSDKWYEKQISEMKPKHDIRIDESVTSAVEPKDTYHLDDPNSVHKYVNELRHQSRMAKASKAEHGHENLVQWADRHIAGLGTEIAAGVLGMLQMVPSFINTIGKWIEPTGEEMPDHDNVPKLLTDYIKLGKEKMQESAEKFRSDPHKEHPWLHQAEQLIDKSASFMTEMFLLGGATKGLEALAKAGEETGLAIKGATQSTIGDKVAQLIKNSVVPLGYFGGKSGTEYIDTHNDIIEYIKENGMPTDATPQEQAYYQAILSNEKDIQRNGYLIGLTEGGAFAAFHGLDVFEKLISPMVEKWGGNAMRKILSSAWIDAAEKGGLAGYAEKAAIAATTMGAETLIPGAASATTFGLITAVPAIVQHMVEERSFNKEWTWKEVGSEVLQSALQGVVMAVPAMVLGPKRGMAEVVYWNEEYLKNRGEAPVEDNIYNPSPLRMWESERTVNHMEENNMITKDDISQAINLSEKGPKGILTEIEKIAKTDPDRAHMIGAYATAVHNIEKIYKDPKFDKTLYKEFVDPLHKMLDTAGKPYDQTVKSETIYKQITESGNENLIQKAGEITDTILQREDLPNAIKDSVISYVLQHLSYAENGMQELGKVRDEQKDLYEKELGKMTEANARRAKDLHEGLMAVIKGERGGKLYDEQNAETTKGIYDKIIAKIEERGGLSTRAEKQAMTMAVVEDVYREMENHFKECIDVSSGEGIDKAINEFKKHKTEWIDSQNALDRKEQEHFIGSAEKQEMMNAIDEGRELPPMPTEDELSQILGEEKASIEEPDFPGMSKTAEAEVVKEAVVATASDSEEAAYLLDNSLIIKRLNDKLTTVEEGKPVEAHFVNEHVGLDYVASKSEEGFTLEKDGEPIVEGGTFKEVTDAVMQDLSQDFKEKTKVKIQKAVAPVKEKEKSGDKVPPTKVSRVSVISDAPKIDALLVEHKRINSPTYSKKNFQRGKLKLSASWRSVPVVGDKGMLHNGLMNEFEGVLQGLFSLPTEEDRIAALKEIQLRQKEVWDRMVDIVPLHYTCEAGNFFVRDDFVGTKNTNTDAWREYHQQREEMLTALVHAGGELKNLKADRVFSNITKGNEWRSVHGTELSKVGKLEGEKGKYTFSTEEGAVIAVSGKVLGLNPAIKKQDLSAELAHLITDNLANKGKLQITEENENEYRIKGYRGSASKLIQMFFKPYHSPASPDRGYIQVDYATGKYFINTETPDGMVQRATEVAIDPAERLRQLEEVREVLATRPVDINMRMVADNEKNEYFIAHPKEGFTFGDFHWGSDDTYKEAMIRNGWLLASTDIDQPYRDTQLRIHYDIKEKGLPEAKVLYESLETRNGKLSPALAPKKVAKAETTSVAEGYEEKKREQLDEELQKFDSENLVFNESDIIEEEGGVSPVSTPEGEEKVFASNGTEYPTIPNKATYDGITKSMANRLVDKLGSNIVAKEEVVSVVRATIENILVGEIDTYNNDTTLPDRERAIGYRQDLLDPERIDTFVSDIINYIKTKGGARDLLDSLKEDESATSTLLYHLHADRIDPFATCNDRLLQVMDNLKGDYDPELTMNRYPSSAETKQMLMNRFGGKFSTLDELEKLLLDTAAKDNLSPIYASFVERVLSDDELLRASFSLFNKEKMRFKDIVRMKNGEIAMKDANTKNLMSTLSLWNKKLIDITKLPIERIAPLAKEMTQIRNAMVKGYEDLTFSQYLDGLDRALSLIGFPHNREALVYAAKSIAEQYALSHEIDISAFPDEGIDKLYKDALNSALSDHVRESWYPIQNNYVALNIRGNVFEEIQRIFQAARGGFKDQQLKTLHAITGGARNEKIPFTELVRQDSPALHRLAELQKRFADEDVSTFVLGPDGTTRYLYRQPSAFGELEKKYLKDPEYVQKLREDARLSANETLHMGREGNLAFSEALAFREAGLDQGAKEYDSASPKDIMLARLFNTDCMRQIEVKGRMPIVQGIEASWRDNDTFLQTHGLAEMVARNNAHSVRIGFLKDMNSNLEDWNALSMSRQQELLGEKSLKSYGMIEGYHYKYIPEKDDTGKLIGWKIDLRAAGYEPRFFVGQEEGRLGVADLNELKTILSTDRAKEINNKQIDEYIGSVVTKMEELGLITCEKNSGGDRLADIATAIIHSKYLPKGESSNEEFISALAEKIHIPTNKIEDWNTSFNGLCERIADSEDPRLMAVKAITGENPDEIAAFIQENGWDFPVPLGEAQVNFSKLSLEGIGKFIKEYGKTPYKDTMRNSLLAEWVRERALDSLIKDIERNELIEGDPAFSGSYDNQTKRLSGMFSTGVKFVNEFPDGHPFAGRTHYKRLNVHDAIVRNEEAFSAISERRAQALVREKGMDYDTAIKQAREETKGVKDIMCSDGQSFISPSMAREMMIRLGQWSELQEEAYNDLREYIDGKKDSVRDGAVIAPVLKCMHWERMSTNQLLADGSNAVLTGYEFHKTSYAPLFLYERDHPMFQVMKYMEDNDIGVLGFGSATKTWGTDKAFLWDGDGKLVDGSLKGLDKYVTEHSWDDLRWQMPTDPHGTMVRKLGIQAMKIIFDVADEGQAQRMTDAISNITVQASKNLDDKSIVSSGMKGTEVLDNSIEALSMGVSIAKLRNPELTKNILQGVSKVLRTHIRGGMLVQVSNIGRKALSMDDGSGRVEVGVNMGALRHLLPRNCSVGKARIILEKINKEVGGIDLLLYRVPTQGVTSMFHGTVKEILPQSAGDVIYFPDPIYNRLGSDNDIDEQFFATKALALRKTSDAFKESDAIKKAFERKINQSRIVDSAEETGVGRERDRVDFDYDSEAHRFALENNAVYNEATDTFEKFTGGKKAFLDNVRFERITGESIASRGNDYLEAAFDALKSQKADLPSTSSVDGPVSHAKDIIRESSPSSEKAGLLQLGVAAQMDARSNNLGGAENIGSYALACSMKGIYKKGNGPMIRRSKPWEISLSQGPSGTIPLTDHVLRPFRDATWNKQGRTIADDLLAYVSLSVDASKDPIMLVGNNNKYTKDACAYLFLEGHGDAGPLLIANPIVREYVRIVEGGEKVRNVDDLFVKAMEKFSTVGKLLPESFERTQEAKKKLAAYLSKVSERVGEKVMDVDWLMKQNKQYKEYLKEGIPMEDWSNEFKDNQIAIMTQFIVAKRYSKALSRKLAINNLDDQFGNNYPQLYKTILNLHNAGFGASRDELGKLNHVPNENRFDPDPLMSVIAMTGNREMDKGYWDTKVRMGLEAINQMREAGMVDFSRPFMDTFHYIASNHMHRLENRDVNLEKLHQSMLSSSYALAFKQIGVDIDKLYHGENTVWDQFWNLEAAGFLDPSNQMVQSFMKYTSMGLKESSSTKVLRSSAKEIAKKGVQKEMIQSFRDMKTYAYRKGAGEQFDKFIEDFITYSYISRGDHVVAHLIPPEWIDNHKLIADANDFLAVTDDYDLVGNALRHAAMDKYMGLGDIYFSTEKAIDPTTGMETDKIVCRGLPMDRSVSTSERGIVAFNTKPSRTEGKPFLVAKMPQGENRVFKLVYVHAEGERCVYTYAIAPIIGEEDGSDYIAASIDEPRDAKIKSMGLRMMYGDNLPPKVVPKGLLFNDDFYTDENAIDEIPEADQVVNEPEKKPEFVSTKEKDIVLDSDYKGDKVGEIAFGEAFKIAMGNVEDVPPMELLSGLLEDVQTIHFPEGMKMSSAVAKDIAKVLEPYAVGVAYDKDAGVAHFEEMKSLTPESKITGALAGEQIAIAASSASQLVNMHWNDFAQIDNKYTNIVRQEDFLRLSKNGLMDIISTFAMNDGFSPSQVADAMGLDVDELRKRFVDHMDDPVVLKIANMYYDEPLSSKLFASFPEKVKREIISHMWDC